MNKARAYPGGDLLDFRAEIAGVPLRAVVFKLKGSSCYIWHWLESMNGAQIHWDLCDDGRRHAFVKVQDAHASYHKDGERHRRVDAVASGADSVETHRIEKRRDVGAEAISTWLSLRRLDVPLDATFPALTTGPQGHIPIILRAADFGHPGIALTAYLCRESSLEALFDFRPSVASWQAGSGSLRLVVFADLAP